MWACSIPMAVYLLLAIIHSKLNVGSAAVRLPGCSIYASRTHTSTDRAITQQIDILGIASKIRYNRCAAVCVAYT